MGAGSSGYFTKLNKENHRLISLNMKWKILFFFKKGLDTEWKLVYIMPAQREREEADEHVKSGCNGRERMLEVRQMGGIMWAGMWAEKR